MVVAAFHFTTIWGVFVGAGVTMAGTFIAQRNSNKQAKERLAAEAAIHQEDLRHSDHAASLDRRRELYAQIVAAHNQLKEAANLVDLGIKPEHAPNKVTLMEASRQLRALESQTTMLAPEDVSNAVIDYYLAASIVEMEYDGPLPSSKEEKQKAMARLKSSYDTFVRLARADLRIEF